MRLLCLLEHQWVKVVLLAWLLLWWWVHWLELEPFQLICLWSRFWHWRWRCISNKRILLLWCELCPAEVILITSIQPECLHHHCWLLFVTRLLLLILVIGIAIFIVVSLNILSLILIITIPTITIIHRHYPPILFYQHYIKVYPGLKQRPHFIIQINLFLQKPYCSIYQLILQKVYHIIFYIY